MKNIFRIFLFASCSFFKIVANEHFIFCDTSLKIGVKDSLTLQNINKLTQLSIDKRDFKTALSYVRQAISLAKKAENKIVEAEAYYNSGRIHYLQENYKGALEFYLKALSIRLEIKNNKEISASLNAIGSTYASTGLYDKAAEFFLKALKKAEVLESKKDILNPLINLGRVSDFKGDYSMSLNYYFKALKIAEDIHDSINIGHLYDDFGNIYQNQGDTEKAFGFYLKALKMTESCRDKIGQIPVLLNIGGHYENTHSYDKAKEYYSKALKISQQFGIKEGIANSYAALGSIYHEQGNYRVAVEHYSKALKIQEEIGSKTRMAELLTYLSQICYDNKKYEKAEVFCSKGLLLSKEIGYLLCMKETYKLLSDIYSKTNRPGKSLEAYKHYISIRDTLVNKENLKRSIQSEANFNFEKKKNQLELIQYKKETFAQQEMQKQITIRNFFILQCVFLFALSIYIYWVYNQKKRFTILLIEQKEEIEKRKSEVEKNLVYTQKLQEALKHDLQHYRQLALRNQMNPHFLFNSLNSIQSFIMQNDKLQANLHLSKFADLMRKVLENSKMEYISLKEEIETLNIYIELELTRFANKFEYVLEIKNNLNLSSYQIPPLLLQPYVENAIWHGLLHKEGEGKLLVSIEKKEKNILCKIEDTGIGREASFKIKNKYNNDHEALGTKITKERIELMNSISDDTILVQYKDLKDSDGNVSGTRVELMLPVRQIEISEMEKHFV